MATEPHVQEKAAASGLGEAPVSVPWQGWVPARQVGLGHRSRILSLGPGPVAGAVPRPLGVGAGPPQLELSPGGVRANILA